MKILILSLITTFCLTGCGNLPKAWEKGILAKPEMTFGGDVLEKKFDNHTFFSKEASSGGDGAGGGGCGCN